MQSFSVVINIIVQLKQSNHNLTLNYCHLITSYAARKKSDTVLVIYFPFVEGTFLFSFGNIFDFMYAFYKVIFMQICLTFSSF